MALHLPAVCKQHSTHCIKFRVARAESQDVGTDLGCKSPEATGFFSFCIFFLPGVTKYHSVFEANLSNGFHGITSVSSCAERTLGLNRKQDETSYPAMPGRLRKTVPR